MVAKATPELASLYVEFAALNQLFQALKMTIAAELSPTIRQLLMLFRILSYGMLEGFKLLMEVAKKLPAIFANAIFGQAGMILVEILQKMLGAFSQSTKLPEPSASPSRGAGLGFSQWEKMGLVISGPSRNWAEVTARNTGRTATAVEKMAGNKEKPKPAEMSLSYQQAP
jgi:uncharacterized protein with PQ loop repeat